MRYIASDSERRSWANRIVITIMTTIGVHSTMHPNYCQKNVCL